MILLLMTGAVLLGTVSIVIWLAILFHPARPWDFQPVAEDVEPPADPDAWPPVCVLVPARNETESLPQTLTPLLTQDYPGPFRVVLVDDRSEDGTADTARALAEAAGVAERLTVIRGKALPDGWVGKVWALEQAAAWCGQPSAAHGPDRQSYGVPDGEAFGGGASFEAQYFLLTDADIRHEPSSLRRLVAESEADGLALNSRMAHLRCESRAERLLIPPFVFFFNLLYPMRQINQPAHPKAGSAGGCVLLSSAGLRNAGGFACIRREIIDDVNLARNIKREGQPIRLALSRDTVASLRVYETVDSIWQMVRRTAFTELRHNYALLILCLGFLTIMFVLPVLYTFGGLVLTVLALQGVVQVSVWHAAAIFGKGVLAWGLMSVVYRPATSFFKLSGAWAWTLPLSGVLYGAMTLDSAARHLAGGARGWR